MWVHGYQGSQAAVRPWPDLMTALRDAPPAAHRDALREQMRSRLESELARDPEEEEVLTPNQLIDVMEHILLGTLPWYGGQVLSFTNTSLTGWSAAAQFLTQPKTPVPHSVDGILDAVERLPRHLHSLDVLFAPAREIVQSGAPPVDAIEAVLDITIDATGCRGEWQRTLFAGFLWMHEACGVPLPEHRRAAIRSWLHQVCPAGYSPEPMTRAEILSAMIQSLQRPVRW
ncbi:MAG: hypothetical protein AAFV53_28230 [Myxococcota bacterium]